MIFPRVLQNSPERHIKVERAAPDSGHKADITGNAVFAGCGQQKNIIGTRRPDGKDGRQGHFYEDR